MSTKQLIALSFGAAMSALIMLPVFAAANPTAGLYKAPLNTYGQPDLEGTWTNSTLTVLERPKEYGARLVMTPEEVKKVEGDDEKMYAADAAQGPPKFKPPDFPHGGGKGSGGGGWGYIFAGTDRGKNVRRVKGDPRPSSTPHPAD